MITNLDKETFAATKAFMSRIKEHYPLEGLILFGSRARQTHRSDSDADVVVLLNGHGEKSMATRLDMADIAFDVLMETGVLVSPIPIWMDEWNHPETYSNPSLLANIRQDGVRL